jgi:hypothetical protein
MTIKKLKFDSTITLPERIRTFSEEGEASLVSFGTQIQFVFKKHGDGIHTFIIEESDDLLEWNKVPSHHLSAPPPVITPENRGKSKITIKYTGKKKYLRISVSVENEHAGSIYKVLIRSSLRTIIPTVTLMLLLLAILGYFFFTNDSNDSSAFVQTQLAAPLFNLLEPN